MTSDSTRKHLFTFENLNVTDFSSQFFPSYVFQGQAGSDITITNFIGHNYYTTLAFLVIRDFGKLTHFLIRFNLLEKIDKSSIYTEIIMVYFSHIKFHNN